MLEWTHRVASRGDDSSSQLLWVVAVLILSAISAIAGKIRERQERARKGPSAPRGRPPAGADVESSKDMAEDLPPMRRPPRRDVPSRPMPQVPRRPAPPTQRPVPSRTRPVEGMAPRPAPSVPRPAAQRQGVRRSREAQAPPVARAPITVSAESDAPARTVLPLPEAKPAAPAAPAAPSRLSLSRRQLRAAIVLREILGPPLALRDEEPWF